MLQCVDKQLNVQVFISFLFNYSFHVFATKLWQLLMEYHKRCHLPHFWSANDISIKAIVYMVFTKSQLYYNNISTVKNKSTLCFLCKKKLNTLHCTSEGLVSDCCSPLNHVYFISVLHSTILQEIFCFGGCPFFCELQILTFLLPRKQPQENFNCMCSAIKWLAELGWNWGAS